MGWIADLVLGYRLVRSSGVPSVQRRAINFKGSAVTVADNPAQESTDVTISAVPLTRTLTGSADVLIDGSGTTPKDLSADRTLAIVGTIIATANRLFRRNADGAAETTRAYSGDPDDPSPLFDRANATGIDGDPSYATDATHQGGVGRHLEFDRIGVPITAASNASPIVCTSVAHGIDDAALVHISGITGNTAANNTAGNPYWTVEIVDDDHYRLVGSTGNGVYAAGGTVSVRCSIYLIAKPSSDGGGLTIAANVGRGPRSLMQLTDDGVVKVGDGDTGNVSSASATLRHFCELQDHSAPPDPPAGSIRLFFFGGQLKQIDSAGIVKVFNVT